MTVAAGGRTATTDGSGSYSLGGLVAGNYTVTPTKTEYDFSPSSRAVSLGPNRSGVDFTATLRTYSISGQVTVSGHPLPGVTIMAGDQTATTDITGSYELTDLISGAYEVTANLADLRFDSARRVTLGPSKSGVDFTATLPDGGKLKVKRTLNFGRVRVGSSKTKGLVLKNKSKTENLWVFVPAPSDPFALVSGGGLIQIGPRGSHTVSLRFAPLARGRFTDVLRLDSSDPRRPVVNVGLRGRAR